MNSKVVTDQMGQKIEVPATPKRIISLMPSQTELLFDLGLDDRIAGLTRFCIHPAEKVALKEKIGGTKNFNIEKIKSLNPDLIIGNKEENYEEGVNELRKHFPVWMSDIVTINEAYDMIKAIGMLTNKEVNADDLLNEIRDGFTQLKNNAQSHRELSAAYFIWRKPYMIAASGTFIHNMMEALGVRNVFENMSRYPEMSTEQIAAARPDLIFLSTEPYAFSEMHFGEFQEMCPTAKVMMVDGELFSWYGSRMRLAIRYFEKVKEEILI